MIVNVEKTWLAFHSICCPNLDTSPLRAGRAFFWLFRGISSRAEVEFAEEEKDSDSEVLEGTEAARVGLDGLDA